METSTAQEAPAAGEVTASDIVQAEIGGKKVATAADKSAQKQPVTATAPTGPEGETEPQHVLTEDDFLSDEEWETLSKKKRKVKFGDTEEEMTLADMYKNTGLNKAITTKAQQAAAEKADAARLQEEVASERRQMQQLFARLKSDPNALYELGQNLGHTQEELDQLAIRRAHERFQYEKMTPEQKRLHALEIENQQFRQMTEAQKQQQIQAEVAELEQSVFDESRQLIEAGIAALGKDGEYFDIDRIAQTSKYLYEKTGKVPSPEDVAANIRQRFDQEFAGRVGKMTGSELLGHLTPKIKSELKELLLRMEAPRVPHGSSQMGSNPTNVRAKKPVGINDFFNKL